MKVKLTIEMVRGSKQYKEKSCLEVKRGLLRLKKEGEIFFPEELCSIGENEAFELHLAHLKTNVCTVGAFPVPLRKMKRFACEKRQSEYLGSHFRLYYREEPWTSEVFDQYEGFRPYISEKYAWYYKK